jgi:hypothetical protein
MTPALKNYLVLRGGTWHRLKKFLIIFVCLYYFKNSVNDVFIVLLTNPYWLKVNLADIKFIISTLVNPNILTTVYTRALFDIA